MKKRNEVLIQLQGVHHLVASVNYQLGGQNWYTLKQEPRGYYLDVMTIERKETEYGVSTMFTLGSGVKTLLLPVSRQSEKQATQALAAVSGVVGTLAQMIRKTLVQANNEFNGGIRNPLNIQEEEVESPFHPDQSFDFAKTIAKEFKKLAQGGEN